MKLATKEDFNSKEQYAIIEFGSIFIEGDERSRTNPGHGYPAHSVDNTKVYLFSSKEEWEKEITNRTTKVFSNTGFKAVIIKPVKVETKISVVIDD